jgi:putative addiction module component (TIGR02574 family)
MLESTQKVLQEVLILSPTERAVLIDALVSGLDRPDSRLDRLWLSKSQERLQAYHRGELEAISAEQVFEELRDF